MGSKIEFQSLTLRRLTKMVAARIDIYIEYVAQIERAIASGGVGTFAYTAGDQLAWSTIQDGICI